MANVQKFYTLNTGVSNNFLSGIWMLSRCMKQAGWTYKASSDGVTKDTTGTASNDKWGGGGTPTSDTYPTNINSNAGWWCARGPGMVKVPFTVASSGTFVRGEPITQATSGATGELLGYVFDATNGGWLVIAPRTGTFNNTNVITGSISAATVTPNGTVNTYAQEVVLWASGTDGVNGTVYWVYADTTAESAQFFSSLTSSAGCTATVAPGGGGSGNTFPTAAIAVLGTGGSNTPSTWATSSTATVHCLVSATNATPSTGVSADGTAWVMFSDTSNSNASCLVGLFRLDDTEPGDLCPFEWLYPTNTVTSSYSRTSNPGWGQLLTWTQFTSNSYTVFTGYIARGNSTAFGTAPDVANYHIVTAPFNQGFGGTPIWSNNNADYVRCRNHPASTKPYAVDTVGLYNPVTNYQQIKGRVRWLRYSGIGNVYDTTDTLSWVTWIAKTTSNPAVNVGPWDGATTPSA
jgi:hypothetical protein